MDIRSNRWKEIEEVFHGVIDLKTEDREGFLATACGQDRQLRSEVEQLLRDSEAAEEFIEKPLWDGRLPVNTSAKKLLEDSFSALEDVKECDLLVGEEIGVFQIVKELGRGGMGAVYLGERIDGEFQQKVAIKLIKRGMDSDFVIERFRNERQILASLEHPHIARLLDGGRTPDGLPYFVLEYVEGESLYGYCDQNRCSIRRRLELFLQLCSAVSHAHGKRIIHRDLKPGNIQVTYAGIPKLLDFGIAKILDSDLIHESISPTSPIMRLMTPDYASPEQISGDEVTPASDIYSLGVLLFELITGHRPYDLAGKSLREITTTVCQLVPENPAKIIVSKENLLSQYSGDPGAMAAARDTNLKDLEAEIENGLDRILMKALAKDPNDRYQSVEKMSRDIERFISGEEIAPPRINFSQPAAFESDFSTTAGKSLAILPFRTINLTSESKTDESFFGLGLADALITRLSKVRHFVVRPTSSISAFDSGEFDSFEAGRQLDVDFILEGNIKRWGERLRVSVQLLDVARNATVWATSIDETVSDFLCLEDALSHKLLDALLPELSSNQLSKISKRGTDSAVAFEHYLRGRYHFNTSTEEGLARSFTSFHDAISEDPEYAHAYAGVADYYNWLGIYGVLPPNQCFEQAIEFAEKAIALDPELTDAHATLGFSLHAANYDWAKGEYHLHRSLELNPNNATAMTNLAIIFFTEGRFAEGLKLARDATRLDPMTPFNHHIVGWGLYFARLFEECTAYYRQLTQNFPNYGLGYYGLSKSLRFQGKTAEAFRALENAKECLADSIFVKFAKAETFAADGNKAATKKILEELDALSDERFVSPYQVALVHCYLGEKEKAFAEIEKAMGVKEPWLNWIGVEPVFDYLRDDDRFQKVLAGTGYDIFFGKSAVRPAAGNQLNDTEAFHNLPTIVLDQNEQRGAIRPAQVTFAAAKKLLKRPLFYAVCVALALIAAFVSLPLRPEKVERKTIGIPAGKAQSIVILPFETASAADEVSGLGLAVALSNRLGYIRRLTVIAPNSARAVKDKPAIEIGRHLHVGHVITGSLTRNSETIRIDAEMIDADDGRSVWKESFVTSGGDLSELQTGLAEKIWTSLEIKPLDSERDQVLRSYTKEAAAYDLYLTGRYQLMDRSPENIYKAISNFSRAINEDPNFALAYAGLADSYALLNLYAMPAPNDAYDKARQYALKAIELDGNLVEAHTSLAFIKFYGDRDRDGAELGYRRAIQLNPSYSQAHQWFGVLMISMNRPTEAVEEMRHAEDLDPDSSIVKTALAMAHFYNERYDQAIKQSEKVLAKDEDFVPAYRVLRSAYLMKKDYKSARTAYQKEISFNGGDPDSPGWYMLTAQLESLSENKRGALAKLERYSRHPSIQASPATYSYEIAIAYSLLGDPQKALRWLEKAESSGDNSFIFVEVDPRLNALRVMPRFRELVKRLRAR